MFCTLAAFAILCTADGAPVSAKSRKKTRFAGELTKGIKTHKDWVERFKETLDPRVFMLLTSRVGRPITKEKAAEICASMEHKPDEMQSLMEKWGITRDPKTYNKLKVKEWEEKYAEEALVMKSKHYIILGTKVDTIVCTFLKYYQEKIYKYYEKMYPTKEKIDGRFLIYIYPDRNQYLASGAPGFSGAYYNASARKLVGYVDGQHRDKRRWIAETRICNFFHEGFLQYFGYFVPGPPVWLNEGGAMMSESIYVDMKILKEMGHMSHRYCKRIKEAVAAGRHTPLETFLRLDHQAFYANPKLHYPQGWALSHFLRYGPKEYREIPSTIVELLLNGADTKTAVTTAFETIDMSKLEGDFVAYVNAIEPELRRNRFHYPGN